MCIRDSGRVDQFNALDHMSFSPRVAAVYKASENHTFRVTYNRSTGAPIGLNLFTDLPLATRPGNSFVWLTGGAEPFTYDNGNIYSFVTGSSVPTADIPLSTLFDLVAPAFNGTPLAPL